MTFVHAASVAAAAALSLSACASGPRTGSDPAWSKDAFETLKRREGAWTTTGSGMPGKVVYRVVGNGSAVQEILFPGEPHEMISMYHLDGPRLVMTHYCAAGNQPFYVAGPGDAPGEIRFHFARLSNGDPARDMHMHEGSSSVGADGLLRQTWIGWQDGKPGEHTVTMELRRQ
ncbi:MAG: hypothetical protein HMLKMBBP_01166 [Planctomycetes bacterium]|nr:hypothetical protein [Planctomycetota bacterium]